VSIFCFTLVEIPTSDVGNKACVIIDKRPFLWYLLWSKRIAREFDEEAHAELLELYPLSDYWDRETAMAQIEDQLGSYLPLEFVQQFDLPEEFVQECLEYAFVGTYSDPFSAINIFLKEGYDRDQVIWAAINTLINIGKHRDALRVAIAHLEPSEVKEVEHHIVDVLFKTGEFDLAVIDGESSCPSMT